LDDGVQPGRVAAARVDRHAMKARRHASGVYQSVGWFVERRAPTGETRSRTVPQHETSRLPVDLVILEVGVDGCAYRWMECPGTEALQDLEAFQLVLDRILHLGEVQLDLRPVER